VGIFKSQKSEQTLEALFKSNARRMYNICLRMTGIKQDAEDVLQEAYYKAYTNIDKLQSMDSFGAWLRRIVVNQSISFQRKQIQFLDIDMANYQTDDMEDNWMQHVSMDRINGAIRELPDGSRMIFNLFLLENYSHKQIAEMLEITESTSKSQYYRAKQLLRESLKGERYDGQI
jgi:RNA polymerase sigma-70 factor (ECF subfamily)